MGVAGRRRLVAQPGGLTSGFAVHLDYSFTTRELSSAGRRIPVVVMATASLLLPSTWMLAR